MAKIYMIFKEIFINKNIVFYIIILLFYFVV